MEAGAIDQLCLTTTFAAPSARRATVSSALPAVDSTSFCQVAGANANREGGAAVANASSSNVGLVTWMK